MRTFVIGNTRLGIEKSFYEYGGHLAVVLWVCASNGAREEPYATLSINLDDDEMRTIGPDEFVLNHDIPDRLVSGLVALGMIEITDRTMSYGYVKDRPVCRLTADPGYLRP